jgi:hypothetical protein
MLGKMIVFVVSFIGIFALLLNTIPPEFFPSTLTSSARSSTRRKFVTFLSCFQD